MIKIVVATNHKGVIGANGSIPWTSKIDLKWFRHATMDNVVIMGKDTWNSLPEKVRPLPGRINIILTSTDYAMYKKRYERFTPSGEEDVWVCRSLKEAIEFAGNVYPEKDICLIGGERVYNEGMNYADMVYHTKINIDVPNGDRFFEPHCLVPEWSLIESSAESEMISGDRVGVSRYVYRRNEQITTPVPDFEALLTEASVKMGKHELIASSLGRMVDEKNRQYGGSYQETETILRLLYPGGIPANSYADFLCIMRLWDKMKRIGASRGDADLGGEDARKDLLGIAIRMFEAAK